MKTDPFEFVCLLLIVSVFVLAGCVELRKGWVKVDFMEGYPSEYLVCHLKVDGDDMTARCVSMEAVEREMKKRHDAQQGDL